MLLLFGSEQLLSDIGQLQHPKKQHNKLIINILILWRSYCLDRKTDMTNPR